MRPLISVILTLSILACDLPIDEKQIKTQIDQRLDNLECQLQSRLANATNIYFREMCNGLDDDCDGEIDEDLYNIPCETACGFGVNHCLASEWTLCDGPQKSEEICNNIDDDCDDETDEQLTRKAFDLSCVSQKEQCAQGTWLCVSSPPIFSCALIETIPLMEPFSFAKKIVHWSYYLHPAEQPTESYERDISIAYVDTGQLLTLTHCAVDQHTKPLINETITGIVPNTYKNIHIVTDAHNNNTVIGITITKGTGQHCGTWYVYEQDNLTNIDSTCTTPELDTYGFVPFTNGHLQLILMAQTSKTLPPDADILIQTLPRKSSNSPQIIGFARPHSMIARRYGDALWMAWRAVKNVIQYTQWRADTNMIEETQELSEGAPLADLHFIDAPTPTFSYTYHLPFIQQLVVHEITSNIDTLYEIPFERQHIALAAMDGGHAILSGVADGEGYEYDYLDIRTESFAWTSPCGKSERPTERDISITADLTGYSIFILHDAKHVPHLSQIRCE